MEDHDDKIVSRSSVAGICIDVHFARSGDAVGRESSLTHGGCFAGC
jgi:hypothetical protein